jgi:hypothetical protein
VPRLPAPLLSIFWLGFLPSSVAAADGSAASEGGNVELTEPALESWLNRAPEEGEASGGAELGAPPLPPRRHGLVLEGSVGALGHLGDMRTVSPIAPWFRLQLGYELLDWLMLLAQGDIALSSTSLAQRPPGERGYALFGVGAGARLAWQPLTSIGFYVQGDAGAASIDQDVLGTYGYPDADRIAPYAGASLGIEWFQTNPHYGLSLSGGARDYFQNFERINGERPPLAWFSSVSIRYAL